MKSINLSLSGGLVNDIRSGPSVTEVLLALLALRWLEGGGAITDLVCTTFNVPGLGRDFNLKLSDLVGSFGSEINLFVYKLLVYKTLEVVKTCNLAYYDILINCINILSKEEMEIV